jgi:hypothetical protein
MIQKIGNTQKDSPATAAAGVAIRPIPQLPDVSSYDLSLPAQSREHWDLILECEFLSPLVLKAAPFTSPIHVMFSAYEANCQAEDWMPDADEAYRLVHAFYSLSADERKVILSGWNPTPFPTPDRSHRRPYIDEAVNGRVGVALMLHGCPGPIGAVRCRELLPHGSAVNATIEQGTPKHIAVEALRQFADALERAWDELVGGDDGAKSLALPAPSPSPAIARHRRAKSKAGRAA